MSARYGLSMVVSLGNLFVLTWWIGPHAYGTFVTAVGLTTFLASLTRFGVDTYLVRCDSTPDTKQYNVAFTLVLTNSTGLMLLGAAMVPLLRRWYSGSEFVAPYLVLLLSILLTGIAGLPIARLEREVKFGVVAGIELGGQFGAFVVALLLAWRGLGVWAPVAGLFAWQAVVLAAAWRAARFSPRLQFDAAHVRTMLAFGLGFSASLRTWQLRTLVNPLLVGRFAGPECVAYVAFALRVVEALGFVRIAASRLAIAALARLQHDTQRFRAALERGLAAQVITLGPLLCAFAVLGPWAVPRFMGARWLPSLEVYPLIAVSVLVNSVFNLQASALFVLGRQWWVMWAYASHVVVLGLATFMLVPRLGIAGYGWAEVTACTAYVFIGHSLAKVVAISYTKLMPWLAVFVLPLFLGSGMPRRALWLPVAAALVAIGYRHLPMCKDTGSARRLGLHGSLSSKVRHLLTLIAKTTVRGWPYLRAIAEYKTGSAFYRIQRVGARARQLLAAELERQRETSFSEVNSSTPPLKLNGEFHFSPQEIPGIVASVPEELKRKVVADAERLMRHRFDFRGEERAFGDVIDWNARGSSTSWGWDLNRHSWFLHLATAFYYTGNPDYLRELATVWEDWIRRNSPASGFNWQYPFEVAARLRNWTWAYVLLAYSGTAERECLGRLKSALQEHAEYQHFHLERHWPNNHLLLEAKTLYEFALLFPEFDRGFLHRAQHILEREVMEQVLTDGVHSELCSMYHRVVAGELGELALLCERNRRPLPPEVAQRIQQMRAFLAGHAAGRRNEPSAGRFGSRRYLPAL